VPFYHSRRQKQIVLFGSSLFSVDFFRQDNRWKQRRVRFCVLLGNSRYTVTHVEAQALTHFRAVTLAVTPRYILGFVTPVRRNFNDKGSGQWSVVRSDFSFQRLD
jgi:hypothetical protein